MVDQEMAESKALHVLRSEARRLAREVEWHKAAIQKLEREYAKIKEKADGDQAYIDEFVNALSNCETDEGRDALRRAQMFVNSVDVDTKYDNTAFIIALGAILSGGKIGAIEALHKINHKIPAPDLNDMWIREDTDNPPVRF
jgi:predicted RNase H-like nuclease (RuvC/YqgF family)